MNTTADRQLEQGGTWERGTFTVPADIPEERVQAVAQNYMRSYGAILEKQGFTIKQMLPPIRSNRLSLATPPDRKRYDLWAWVFRLPETVKLDIPDIAVPALQRNGLKLLE